MNRRTQGNALLTELMIAIAFFMLCVSVLIQVFAGASRMSATAGRITAALDEAQSVADALLAAEDREALLKAEGFSLADGRDWTRTGAEYTLGVALAEEQTEQGRLVTGRVYAGDGTQELLSLPLAVYKGGQT